MRTGFPGRPKALLDGALDEAHHDSLLTTHNQLPGCLATKCQMWLFHPVPKLLLRGPEVSLVHLGELDHILAPHEAVEKCGSYPRLRCELELAAAFRCRAAGVSEGCFDNFVWRSDVHVCHEYYVFNQNITQQRICVKPN